MSRDVPGKRRSAARAFPLAWRAIDQCDHFSVEHDSFHGIVRVTRTSDAFPDVATLREVANNLDPPSQDQSDSSEQNGTQ